MPVLYKVVTEEQKITTAIANTLKIDAMECFPTLLYYGVISDGYVNLFVRNGSQDRQKLYGNNFGTLF